MRNSIFMLFAVLAGYVPLHATETFDYHSIRRQGKVTNNGIIEGESDVTRHGKARAQGMKGFGPHWHGDEHLLWDGVVGQTNLIEFSVPKAGRYALDIQWTLAPDYGIFEVSLNDMVIAPALDLYSNRVELSPLQKVESIDLKKGLQRLVVKLTGGNPKSRKFQGRGYLYGLDYIRLTDLSPKPEAHRETGNITTSQATLNEVQPLLAKYCFTCHGKKKVKGKINLEAMNRRDDFLKNVEVSRLAAEAVSFAEMPPTESKIKPETLERKRIVSFFNGIVDEYVRDNSTLEPVVMRRLNRYEYNNAVRDLLRLRGDIYPLPEKVIRSGNYFNPASGNLPARISVSNRTLGKNQVEKQILQGVDPFAIDLQAEHGFNNQGEQLSISPLLLESLLKLGRSIVNSPEFDRYTALFGTFFKDDGKLVEERLRPFLERAFRTPIEETVLKRYASYHREEQSRTGSYTQAMKNVVAAVLASPKFIYVAESKKNATEKSPVNDYEMAQRLALFLWSSIPDRQLIDLARSGKLHQPDVLDQEVRRMLDDPRSRALSENFARQWLRLDQLITAVPDFDRFQVYYSRIGCEQWKFGLQTMVEPLLLFESIQVEDRSIMLLVDSNYSYRSDELQNWYSKPGEPFGKRGNRNRFNTNSQNFQRRTLANRREGGVMTTAAVLTMTSTPLRTSPIKRGAWVATVIFNDPPPPPPDVVPEIEADDAEIEARGLTIRQRLKQHATDQSCASCHAKIDPLGFVLESYDPIGRWREKYSGGLPIDASGRIFGDKEFKDIIAFKDAILDQPQNFMRGFSEHLLAYALGRELKVTDKPAVDRITREVIADHGRFSTVVVEIAKSFPFLHKTSQKEPQ